MRDIKRIDRICNKLKELWHYHPDMRFGQLIQNYIPIDWNMEDTKECEWKENYNTEYFIDKEINDCKLWKRVCKETTYLDDHEKWSKKWMKDIMNDDLWNKEPKWENYIKELKDVK